MSDSSLNVILRSGGVVYVVGACITCVQPSCVAFMLTPPNKDRSLLRGLCLKKIYACFLLYVYGKTSEAE